METVIYRWQQAVPPTMALAKNVLVIMNFAYTLLVLNYSCVGFMVRPLSLPRNRQKHKHPHLQLLFSVLKMLIWISRFFTCFYCLIIFE